MKIQLEKDGHGRVAIDNKLISFSPKLGFLISPVMPEHAGYYTCKASYGDRSNEYAVSLSVLPQTSYVPPPPSLHPGWGLKGEVRVLNS